MRRRVQRWWHGRRPFEVPLVEAFGQYPNERGPEHRLGEAVDAPDSGDKGHIGKKRDQKIAERGDKQSG